jgi:hypothetical protein
MFLDILTANQIYQTERYKDVWGAEGISGRVKFLPLAWVGMPKTSFRKNSDSPIPAVSLIYQSPVIRNIFTLLLAYAENPGNVALAK